MEHYIEIGSTKNPWVTHSIDSDEAVIDNAKKLAELFRGQRVRLCVKRPDCL